MFVGEKKTFQIQKSNTQESLQLNLKTQNFYVKNKFCDKVANFNKQRKDCAIEKEVSIRT